MVVQARIAAGIAAAAALGVLLTACAGPTGSAAPSKGSAPATTATAAGPVTAKQAATSDTSLQFPNKNLTVQLDGYDSTLHMVEFHLAVWVAGGADDGHYGVDPTNTGAHRLPLAPDASITSLSPLCTGASKGNPNVDGSACTLAQLTAALLDDSGAGPAKLHVNANDQIQTAQELYHP
jgi:hypothetical protein